MRTQEPIARSFTVEVHYTRWRTEITIRTVDPDGGKELLTCILPGKYTQEKAKQLWEKEPERFVSIKADRNGNGRRR